MFCRLYIHIHLFLRVASLALIVDSHPYVCPSVNFLIQKDQESFWVWAQPMKGGIRKKCFLSLVKPIHKIIPVDMGAFFMGYILYDGNESSQSLPYNPSYTDHGKQWYFLPLISLDRAVILLCWIFFFFFFFFFFLPCWISYCAWLKQDKGN